MSRVARLHEAAENFHQALKDVVGEDLAELVVIQLGKEAFEKVRFTLGESDGVVYHGGLLFEETFGLEEVVEWQPIETAPKDGTHVWLSYANGQSEGPTHWHPLPHPPTPPLREGTVLQFVRHGSGCDPKEWMNVDPP